MRRGDVRRNPSRTVKLSPRHLQQLQHLDAVADAEAVWRRSVKLLSRAKGVGVDYAEMERACEHMHVQAREAASGR